jgi:hypothetical protein
VHAGLAPLAHGVGGSGLGTPARARTRFSAADAGVHLFEGSPMSRMCQCRPGCPLGADDGFDYVLAHDPTPERAEEKRLDLLQRSKNAGKASGKSRRENGKHAAREALKEALASPVPLKTEADIRAFLEVLAAAAKFGGIPPARIASGVKAAQAAQALLAAELEKQAAEVRELLEELERAREAAAAERISQ